MTRSDKRIIGFIKKHPKRAALFLSCSHTLNKSTERVNLQCNGIQCRDCLAELSSYYLPKGSGLTGLNCFRVQKRMRELVIEHIDKFPELLEALL